MKLYIATTSLNFDAIVSTDSVSPASFYPQRNFGIPFVYEKASLCLRNSILLTDVYPIFNIGKSDVDHRPMVIEIDADNYPDRFKQVRNCDGFSVYSTDKTIYLSPLSCRLYFRSEADKRATVSKAESILESKYLLYERMRAISVYDGHGPNAKIDQNTFKGIIDNPVLNSESIKEDIQINKAKGFIFSYLIGASQAISADSARLLRLTKEIKNGIYSLGTKEGKSKNASDAISRYAYEAEAISESLDTRKIAARKRVDAFLETNDSSAMLRGSSTDEIILFLEKTDLYRTLYNRLNSGRLFSIIGLVQSVVSSKDDSGLESSLEELEKYVHSIVQHGAPVIQVQELFTLFGLNYMEVKDSALTDETRRKVETMYNLYSGYNYVATGIRENRIDYIIDAGKEFFPEQTLENQRERDYVNAMLDNLEHAASFDIMGTESAALQALAVFMRSPDADLDKMASLIISNEIPDARIAFGLWGLFHGYSSIPQSYYNEYVRRIQPKDIAELVRELYSMLFGTVPVFGHVSDEPRKSRGILGGFISLLKGEEEEKHLDAASSEVQGDLFRTDFSESGDVRSIDDNVLKEKTLVANPAFEESALAGSEDLPNGYEYMYETLLPVLDSAEVTSRTKADFFAYYPPKIKDACYNALSLAGLRNAIAEIPIAVAKMAWKGVRPRLFARIDEEQLSEIEQESRARREKMEKEVSSGGRIKKFYRDEYAWDIILSVLPKDKTVIDQVKKDFSWFMDNYGNPPYYENKPTDNESCLNAFARYLRKKRDENYNSSIRKIYSKVDVDLIVAELRTVYN